MSDNWWESDLAQQIILLLVGAIAGVIVALPGHLRGTASDKRADRAIQAASEREETSSLIEGLNNHIDSLLADNKDGRQLLREQVKECADQMQRKDTEIKTERERGDRLETRNHELEEKIAQLEKGGK